MCRINEKSPDSAEKKIKSSKLKISFRGLSRPDQSERSRHTTNRRKVVTIRARSYSVTKRYRNEARLSISN